MNVQLQTYFAGNYGLRRNATPNTGVSKMNFGASTMNAVLVTEQPETRINIQEVITQRAAALEENVNKAIKELKINEPVVSISGAELTGVGLLNDIAKFAGNDRLRFTYGKPCASLAYLDRFGVGRVQQAVTSYVDSMIECGVFKKLPHRNGSGYDIQFTKLGRAVTAKLLGTAKVAIA
jgi:hypothetical protein